MEEDVKRTSLSAGLAVFALLKGELGNRVTKIYPVVSDENAEMPFAVYRRTGIKSENVKGSTAFDFHWDKKQLPGVTLFPGKNQNPPESNQDFSQ